jgi:hypothetical protein
MRGKVSGVICFALCAGNENLLPPLHNPHHFCFCLCLDVWQQGEWEEVRVRTPPLACRLRNLKKGLMEIIESN